LATADGEQTVNAFREAVNAPTLIEAADACRAYERLEERGHLDAMLSRYGTLRQYLPSFLALPRDDDVALAGWPRRPSGAFLRLGTLKADAIGMDRSGDVLQRLLAHVLERKTELVAHRIAHAARYANAARLGQPLQPRGDVHPVAEDVPLVMNDVA
jgi:hypothetical protein